MSDRALMGQRVLTKDIPSLTTDYTPGVGWTLDNGWQSEGNLLFFETYYDLSGYSMDDLTTVIDLIVLQDSNRYFLTYAGADQPLTDVLDIVSDVRLDMSDMDTLIGAGELPGTSQSTDNYEQIKYCNLRGMMAQVDFSNLTLLRTAYGGSYGSAQPTTAEKLYIYRIVRVAGQDLDNAIFTTPATRFVTGITVIKEEERPFLMRQKRSYELQQ